MLLMEGSTLKTIADRLFISERTVKFHCKNAYIKLNVQNRKELLQCFGGQ